MTTLTFLVDEAGGLWNAGSIDFHQRLGVRDPDFDAAAFAVKNFGWIEITYGRRRVTVRLRPETAEPNAVKFLQDVLTGTDKPEILIKSWQSAWRKDKFLNSAAALAHLEGLLAPAHERRSARFISVQVPIEQIFRDKQVDLIEQFRLWRTLFGNVEPEEALRLISMPVMARTSVIEHRHKGAPFIFRHIPATIRHHDQATRLKLIGTDVADSPDRDYGAWCIEQGYRLAVSSAQPVVQDVQAIVQRPNAPFLYTNYRRLLTAFKTRSGADILFVAFEPMPRPALSRVA